MLMKRYCNPTKSGLNPLTRIHEDWDQLFGVSPLNGFLANDNGWSPSLDVVEEKNQYVLKLELPGVKSEDVSVTFEDGVLTIAGERKDEKSTDENKVHLSERYYGRFERSVKFPAPVDSGKIAAKFNHGVLEVALPKTEEAKPRQIQIAAE